MMKGIGRKSYSVIQQMDWFACEQGIEYIDLSHEAAVEAAKTLNGNVDESE
jgi:hypothetical protein